MLADMVVVVLGLSLMISFFPWNTRTGARIKLVVIFLAFALPVSFMFYVFVDSTLLEALVGGTLMTVVFFWYAIGLAADSARHK
jgi:hypothetical protein